MRISLCFALLAVVACSSGNDGNDGSPDGGSTTSTNPDGGTVTNTPDAGGGGACNEGETQACTGSTDGSCDPGVRSCVGGTFGPCEGRIQPVPGMCDIPSCAGGENPGCACRVGTSRECYTATTTSTLGHGPCVQGFQQCVAKAGGSEFEPCHGDVTPKADDCSGRNLDCDDKAPIAADCACTNGDTRPCGGVSGGTCALGTQTCTGGAFGACVGAVQPVKGDCEHESCAGGPNPGCECVIGATEPCYTGLFGSENQGSCKAGTRTCNELGRWGACLGQNRPVPSCDIESCSGTPLSVCE